MHICGIFLIVGIFVCSMKTTAGAEGIVSSLYRAKKILTGSRFYTFSGKIYAREWIRIPEPVEFEAPVSGILILEESTEISNSENSHSVHVEGYYLGNLTLPKHKTGKQSEEEGDQIQGNKAEVTLNVEIRTVKGTSGHVDIKGYLEGDAILNDKVTDQLNELAKNYVGLDGRIRKVGEIQVEGTFLGEING